MNSTLLIISELTNENARKTPFTSVVYTTTMTTTTNNNNKKKKNKNKKKSKICWEEVSHNEKTSWLEDIELEFSTTEVQEHINITVDDLKQRSTGLTYPGSKEFLTRHQDVVWACWQQRNRPIRRPAHWGNRGRRLYKYLGILQLDKTLNTKMKGKITSEYIRRVKKLCRSKLNGGNLICGINTWAVSVVRYSVGIVDWTVEEVVSMDSGNEWLSTHQVRVVQKVDNAIHWINHYPLDSAIGFAMTYPLDSDLSGG